MLLKYIKKNLFHFPKYQFTTIFKDNLRFFVVEYTYVDDMNYKRVPHIEKHDELIKQMEEQGTIIFGGSFMQDNGAIILFNCQDERTPYDFVQKDSFYQNQLIKNYIIKEFELHKRTQYKELAKVNKYQ